MITSTESRLIAELKSMVLTLASKIDSIHGEMGDGPGSYSNLYGEFEKRISALENPPVERPFYVHDGVWDYAIRVWGSPKEALEFFNRMVLFASPHTRMMVERLEQSPSDEETRQRLSHILFERLLEIERGLPA